MIKRENPQPASVQEVAAPHVASHQPLHELVLAAPLVETILPGQAEAEPWVRQHGASLVAVRLRVDPRSGVRYTSVEVLAELPEARCTDAAPLDDATAQTGADHDGEAWVSIKVGLSERQLQRRLQAVDAEFNERTRTWCLRRAQAVAMGLEARIA